MFMSRKPPTRSNLRLVYGTLVRRMATVKAAIPHIERTAAEPRHNRLHRIVLSQITQVNSTIRLLRLSPVDKEPIRFQPGQWVDLHIPTIYSPGGFTLTCTPSTPHLELAVQKPQASAHDKPAFPASWLWQPACRIINSELAVRVGGGFVWPPANVPEAGIRRVVFVAGGVGINPLISMLGSIAEAEEHSRGGAGGRGFDVRFLYSVRALQGAGGASEEILFLDRLRRLLARLGGEGELRLFVTGAGAGEAAAAAAAAAEEAQGFTVEQRRIRKSDLEDALGSSASERAGTVCYVCGVPRMTDEFVHLATRVEGMDESRVLSEKWW
ncbi:uncharacterized protein L3040_001034 [Drepanopeziza brunnea f. sp. 'multigermtubi']|uniref:Oxidoreductase NAD-binding domain-containing protein 1 n=1 Tax=Marssonina brunnea f. sp. multigermtubi (strain MB_m1) TaxID=1072389 RepID=K1WUW0_MARBU|nr:NADH-cytochrome b-5 reductase [Drepanopeziza brunnea f. sp. 'multigermtubi' MB_m1]EKD12423.1 NADH-cytochrome b-5 reductase [Drepanopeziza brunnea f. sp. 'multigermtubi' MB_m1]KAJ5054770.1 hypothetical protein L3040_001034 [Drepanopeziza brunnea f. sp. 'multigermtubi']